MVLQTLPFDGFWNWLLAHPNCILRAGTPEAVLYDDDDVHWHFASEGPERLVVQLIRGKRVQAELIVEPEQVAYVEEAAGDAEGEFVFDLITESENERFSAWFFVLSHGYEAESGHGPTRIHLN
ncbi:MAG TPA: hypothetical protein PKX99_02845 [Thermoanaerobaculia bacterium]|jgi:hypothetical protein|nr:hypothetical protein [Acidobacteriota bacterium]HPK65497.1 hypothetical protein [Thermoanaerobaculia bacterium]